MKKIFIFLILFLGINALAIKSVNARGMFYEGNYIDGIWMTKEKGGTKFYQKARFFNLTSDGSPAYCIEPFATFNENAAYTPDYAFANNLTVNQQKQIDAIAYFGYGFGNHTDDKWYAITQMMIWKAAEPYANMYFTDSLNGNRIEIFNDEMNEINYLINNYYTLPTINGVTVDLVEGKTITLTDNNNVLSNYISTDSNAIINGNKLFISNLDEGEHTIQLIRKTPVSRGNRLYYNGNNTQNMMTVGSMPTIYISLKVNVIKTTVNITKIDSDTKTTTPTNEAKLSGAIYELQDKNMNKLDEIEIDDSMNGHVENLDFGKYYLKEIKAGTGYTIDEELHEFEITKDNHNIELTLENKVIEKEITIHKTYGDGTNGDNEQGISFDIINYKNEIIKTITTDHNGYAKITLPYGKYIFKQKNTTEGYKLTDDFEVTIEDNEKKEIYLYDYKIPVPNTYKNKSNLITYLLLIIGVILVKKRAYC